MTDRPPVELHELSTSARFPSLEEQLVSLGGHGAQDMSFIRQLYPIESIVYQGAINEFAHRVDLLPTSTQDGPEIAVAAQRYLGLTLVPFARRFLGSDGDGTAETTIDQFRIYARPWALSQLRSCCAAIAALIVADYRASLKGPLIGAAEAAQLEELGRQIEQLERRPDAKRLLVKLREAYVQLSDMIESRIAIDPVVARSLSYLLASTSAGFLTDNAVAALIMKGNDSPGCRATRNPLQLVDVRDVAQIFATSERSVTNMVSKFRQKAMNHPDVAHVAVTFDVTQLWVRIDPTSPTELVRVGHEGSPR